MEKVHITPSGMLTTAEGNTVQDPLPALHCLLYLEPECTLRSFFSMLVNYPILQSLSEFLPVATAEGTACPSAECKHDEINLLVIGKTMELIGFPGEPRAVSYLWLRGFSGAVDCPTATTKSMQESAGTSASIPLYAGADKEIRFIPLRMLLDTPLALGGLKHILLGSARRELFCTSSFTLFETIDGLAWEFGFQNDAQQCSLRR